MDFVSKKINFQLDKKVYLIGEIGVNHNRNLKTLFNLIDVGISAGVDIIKLQRFNSELEISKYAPITDYQKKNCNFKSQLALAKSLELPDEWIFKAYSYCKKKKIGFLCAAFDNESVDFISEKLKCTTVKSPSSEITNKFLLERMSKKFKSIIVSTGASTMKECLNAKKWILKTNKAAELLFMHCVSEYPSPLAQSNLNVIKSMKKKLKLPIGFSDHTDGIIAPIMSVQNGCVLIEKHYTLDKNMKGPDHKASLDPVQLKMLAETLKRYYEIMGNGVKKPQRSELKNKNLIRKSIVCSKNILKKGKIITEKDINFKRPYFVGSVIPEDYKKIIGRKLKLDLSHDKPFFFKYFK